MNPDGPPTEAGADELRWPPFVLLFSGWTLGRESCLQPIVTAARTRLSHMDYYLLEYALIDDYLARRAAFREAHLALAREAHRRGDLILAGALAEPTDRAVLVWRTDDRSVVERFIDGDPYVHNGLVTSWTIRPWTVVIGEGAGQS